VPDLALLLLLVSCASLALQAAALIRIATRHPGTDAEGLVSRGYVRTIACRVAAAVTYTAAAAVQVAGSGSLSAEALIVFACVQGLWVSNSLLDIRMRRRLAGSGGEGTGRHARAG
jgi:hypothetical protein